MATLLGAISFYTCIPLPPAWHLEFWGIARWVPLVGVGLGTGLGLLDWGLACLGLPILTRSAAIVLLWLGITGGLHLDGAMDTADGLAVLDPDRRLAVMADSHTGAFGAMVAVALLLLKTAALSDIETGRWFALASVAGWGRWGQLLAILRYPYLRVQGKGAFHKAALSSRWELLPSLGLLLAVSGCQILLQPEQLFPGITVAAAGVLLAWGTGAYFNHKLGGQTGDTYGAIVEWTEALLLFVLTPML